MLTGNFTWKKAISLIVVIIALAQLLKVADRTNGRAYATVYVCLSSVYL